MIARSTLAIVAAALAAGTVGSASAEGLYMGADIGHPQYSNDVNGIGGGDAASNGGIGAKLYGGYTLTPNFALEGSVFRLGHTRMGDETANTTGVALDGVGNYMFAPKWSVLGRLGVAEGHFSTSLGNDSSAALKMGAGVQYDWTNQVAFRVQYERYHFLNAFESKPNVGEVTAGIKVSF
jgi:OOP family OmpA-OmpF porin